MYVFHCQKRVMSFSAGDAVSKDLVKEMTDAQVEEVVKSNDFTPTPKTVGVIGICTPICPHMC